MSILKLIEKRDHLAPLSAGDANPTVRDLTSALRLDEASPLAPGGLISIIRR